MRPWLPLLCVLLASGPGATAPLAPWQGNASLAASLGSTPAEGASFFLGHVWGQGEGGQAIPFLSAGAELTLPRPRAAYDSALGLQVRAGMAWAQPTGAAGLWPDLLVFARVAPFVAAGALSVEEGPARRLPPSVGLRVGLGLTAGAWTQWLLDLGLPEEAMAPGWLAEVARVVTGLVLMPVALLNHVELTLEMTTRREGPPTRSVALRVGSGF